MSEAGLPRSLMAAFAAAVLAALGLVFSLPQVSVMTLCWAVMLLACMVWAGWLLWCAEDLRTDEPQEESPAELTPQAADDGLAFLSVVGHDLRQPLQAVSLYAATLATHDLPGNSRQLVSGLEAAAETLSMQFEEVMAIAKLDAGRMTLDPRPLPLSAILASTVAGHLATAHEKSLHLRHVDTRLRVATDEAQLARAVDRLVAHALRTTDEGGVLLGCRRRGTQVLIEVRDSGRAVPREQAEGLFTPFSPYGQRLPDRALGLVLASRIVRQLGGSLTHRSAGAQGNIYTIALARLGGR